MDKFELGMKLKDIVTGFEGIAIARIEYLNGCVQYCLKPPVKDGKLLDGEYFDVSQLSFVDNGIKMATKETGGNMPDKAPRL